MPRSGPAVALATGVLVAVFGLATPDMASAQGRPTSSVSRAAVVSAAHPRPQTTRAMGVPASVQPSGLPARRAGPFPPQPFPAHPIFWPADWFSYYPFFWPTAPVAPYPVGGPMGFDEHGSLWRPVRLRHQRAAALSTSISAGRCVVVEVHGSGGVRRDLVVLPALGAETPESLLIAMTELLEAGRQVPLVSLNGTRLVIPAGPGTTAVAVHPCGPETGMYGSGESRQVGPW